MAEPKIEVDGIELTDAQSMAVRMAVTSAHAELNDPDEQRSLGELAQPYQTRLGEVLEIMFRKQ